MRARSRVLPAFLVSASILAGCDHNPAAPAETFAPAPETSPIRAAEAGIEILSWAVDDSTGAVGRALAPYTPDDRTPGAWRSSGLRLLRVPREQLEAIGAAIPTVGPLRRQWFGMLASWTPIFTGRAWSGRAQVALDEGGKVERLSLGPGRLRILARCWSEPRVNAGDEVSPAAAALRVEIVPQHEEAAGSTIGFGSRADQARRGQMFETLSLSFTAEPGAAYVIVPETPGAVWATAEEASNDRPLGPPRLVEEPGGIALPPTLGETMLTDAAAGGMARTRIILVIVPRTPEKFELIR